jgi:hypothetical protein
MMPFSRVTSEPARLSALRRRASCNTDVDWPFESGGNDADSARHASGGRRAGAAQNQTPPSAARVAVIGLAAWDATIGRLPAPSRREIVAVCDVYQPNAEQARCLAGGRAEIFAGDVSRFRAQDVDAVGSHARPLAR